MVHILKASHRCQLFENIAVETWQNVADHRIMDVHPTEDGITNSIVTKIRSHATYIRNFGVWSNRGFKEAANGSDIDIFVETSSDNFIWYALQAKVLYRDGTYGDLHTLKGGEHQWEKLERLQLAARCEINYLLYNGVPEFRHNGRDMCKQPFDATKFGCSIVPVYAIKSSPNPARFADFHPSIAQPWHILVCCFKDPGDYTLFSATQIKQAVNSYPNKTNSGILDEGDQEFDSSNGPGGTDADNQGQFNEEINAIISAKEIAGWEPDYTVVIRNTASL